MKVHQLLQEFEGVDLTIGKPEDVKKAWSQLIMQDGPFEVSVRGQSSDIDDDEIAAVKTLARTYMDEIAEDHRDGITVTVKDVVQLTKFIQAFQRFVQRTPSTHGVRWAFDMAIFKE